MSDIPAIIVYRNPWEAAMWEAMSGGQMFPILVGMLVIVVVTIMADALLKKADRAVPGIPL